MTDYISRDAAKEHLLKEYPLLQKERLVQAIASIHAADVRENKRGKWETKQRHEHYPSGEAYEVDYCSVCGKRGSKEFLCCPNCGARMSDEEEQT